MPVTVQLENETYEARRIFCIGRNYAAHAAELGNEIPSEPVVFMKPATAIVPTGEIIRLPQDRGSVQHEAELVLLIGSDGGTGIDAIAGISLGLDLTLRDEQARLKRNGLPWELAKAFDGSAPLGEFAPPPSDFNHIEFNCMVNGQTRQHGDTRNLLFPIPRLLTFLAGRFRLLHGDLVFTGTPEGVAPLRPGDHVELASRSIGRFGWQCE